ncbi:MAG: YcxB family protein [Xanthomonadaceae bacterium]|jgi:hypothetical protein|nr:YcxB family protein [Xanthomonadaceae bacterium]
MKADYLISEDDYVAAMQLHAGRSPWLLLAIIGGTLAIMLVSTQRFPLTFWTAGICLILMVGMLASRHVVVPEFRRRQYRASEMQERRFSVELLDDGIRFIFPGGERQVPWSAISRWRENRRCVLVYLSPDIFQVVPKSVVEKGFDIKALTGALIRNVGSAT